MLEKEDLKKRVIEIINDKLNLPHYKVFLFGSRVNGKASERSDYDIGLEVSGKIAPGVLMDIEDELKALRIMQKIDLVNFANVSPEFKEVALRDIEVIYER
jgi:predicted nucleotidyltransferase